MDDDKDRPPEPGDRVGLGRVVDNPAGLGREGPDQEAPGDVDEASEASFPASDPPGFTPEPASAGEADDLPGTELPDREDPV